MRDRILIAVVAIIGSFIIGSTLAVFVLVYTGRIEVEEAVAWRPLFDLVSILVGAVAGYIGGVEVERRRGGGSGEGQP